MLQSIASAIQIFQFDFQRLLHVVVACGVLHVPKKNLQTRRPVLETAHKQPTSKMSLKCHYQKFCQAGRKDRKKVNNCGILVS